jgi:SAM-dependent methyltransferase
LRQLYQADLAYIQAAGFGDLPGGAAPAIVQRLKSAAVISVKRVIDAGCGAGPLTAALTDAGFDVTGIDQSSELLESARKAAPAARFLCASIYEVALPACEAVIALGEPLTYHDREADADGRVKGFFRRVSEVLPSGGMFIFDLIETGEPSLTGRFWTSGDDWVVLGETVEDAAARTLVRTIETFRRAGDMHRRGREVHRVRLFDSQDIGHWLEECGFAVETDRCYGQQKLGPRRRAFFATRSTGEARR